MARRRKTRNRRTKLYYFDGRNTGVAATTVDQARRRKKRGSHRLIAVRTPKPGEFGRDGKKWSRVRRDGKSPNTSRYGKGRGQGPARRKK